jgi:RimJ/RimL family protein N-acetyltransferase
MRREPLRGDRIVLRPLEREHLARCVKWFNDPEVTQYLGMYLPMTEMAEEKWIEDTATDRTRVNFVIEAIEGEFSKPIGSTGLENINTKDHSATFGIAIGDKDYWSKGYGTEAARLLVNYGFEQLNLHRVNSFVIGFNDRSLNLHKSLGFTEEGRMRQAVYRNGKYYDHVVAGILREEWKGI